MAEKLTLNTSVTPNGKPVDASTIGVPLPFTVDRALVRIAATVNSGQIGSLTGRLWVKSDLLWFPAGPALADNDPDKKGVLNGGMSITETDTDIIRHVEEIGALIGVDEVFFQVVSATQLATLAVALVCIPLSLSRGG